MEKILPREVHGGVERKSPGVGKLRRTTPSLSVLEKTRPGHVRNPVQKIAFPHPLNEKGGGGGRWSPKRKLPTDKGSNEMHNNSITLLKKITKLFNWALTWKVKSDHFRKKRSLVKN